MTEVHTFCKTICNYLFVLKVKTGSRLMHQITQWLTIIDDILVMENLTCRLKMKEYFAKGWGKWLNSKRKTIKKKFFKKKKKMSQSWQTQ